MYKEKYKTSIRLEDGEGESQGEGGKKKEQNLGEMYNKARCERGEVPPSLLPDTPKPPIVYAVYSVHFTVYSVNFTVYSVQCIV